MWDIRLYGSFIFSFSCTGATLTFFLNSPSFLAPLNSNLIIYSVEFIPSFSAYKVGHTLEIYKRLSNLENVEYIDLGITQYKSVNDYTILPLYSTSPPYLVVGSLWIYKSGNVSLYKKSETTECFISGNYIFEWSFSLHSLKCNSNYKLYSSLVACGMIFCMV